MRHFVRQQQTKRHSAGNVCGDESKFFVRDETLNKCVCIQNYVLISNECVQKAVCDLETQVYVEASNECECAPDYVDIGQGCVQKVKCDSTTEHFIEYENICVCKDGYHRDGDMCVEY